MTRRDTTPRTTPFWWEDAGPPAATEAAPLPAEADLVIVGGGLTGLSAARTAARRGRQVVVLDARAPGMGASSRNGGMVGGGHRLSLDALSARFGAETAAGLLREAYLDSAAFVERLIRDEAIDCDYRVTGRFRALWRSREYDPVARELDRLQALMPLEAWMLPRARQHEEIASDLYRGGVIYPRHAALNPAGWVAGLRDAAQRAGALVQGDTPVTGIGRTATAFTVRTTRGPIRAGDVLIATNGYTAAPFHRFRRAIIPVPSFIVATEVLGRDRVRSLIPHGRMIVETRERHCYFRPSPDGRRIIFGGRAAMFDAPEALVRRQMRALLVQVFPQLKGIRLTHSWRGRTGFTFNFLPAVGQMGGLWYAMGYSGSGNAMAPWLGHKAALRILGDPEGETAFSRTGLPTRWWHPGPAWFLPLADVTFRFRDLLAGIGRGT